MKRLAVLMVLAILGVPRQVVAAVDVADLPSVVVGTTCIAKGMRLQDVVMKFEGNRAWELRWDEKMVTKTGLVAALASRNGRETPFLLAFTFADSPKAPVGHARLTRIGWGGKASETGAKRLKTGCAR
jgi:hypothetical protein